MSGIFNVWRLSQIQIFLQLTDEMIYLKLSLLTLYTFYNVLKIPNLLRNLPDYTFMNWQEQAEVLGIAVC